jgi:hypothetical protein
MGLRGPFFIGVFPRGLPMFSSDFKHFEAILPPPPPPVAPTNKPGTRALPPLANKTGPRRSWSPAAHQRELEVGVLMEQELW